MDELLLKYLLQESSEEEEKQVSYWLQQNEKNKQYFEQLKLIWEQSKNLESDRKVDVNAAWAQFEQKIKNIETPAKTSPKKKALFSLARMAAAVLLVGVVGLYFYINNRPVVLLAQQSVRQATLPDQSVVTLNKHAVLRFPQSFNQKERKINLEGEAFFEVTKNKEKPFEVEVNGVLVKVLGTSFNIKSKHSATEIIVETGRVQVTANGQTIELLPGQKVKVYKGSTDLNIEENTGLLYNYYRSQELICNNTPLIQLVETLNDAYDADIQIARADLAQQRITTRFQLTELDKILEVVAATLNISVIHKEGKIILQ